MAWYSTGHVYTCKVTICGVCSRVMCTCSYHVNRLLCSAVKTNESKPILHFVYQYIKIVTCVCVTEVGCLWGGTRLVTHDLRTSINLELCEECSRTLGPGMGWKSSKQMHAIMIREQQSQGTQSGEQQLKRTRPGSSS